MHWESRELREQGSRRDNRGGYELGKQWHREGKGQVGQIGAHWAFNRGFCNR